MKIHTIHTYLSLFAILTSFSCSSAHAQETMNPLISSLMTETLRPIRHLTPLMHPTNESSEYDGDDESLSSAVSEFTLSQTTSSQRSAITNERSDLDSPFNQGIFHTSASLAVSSDSEERKEDHPVHIYQANIVTLDIEQGTDLNSTIFRAPTVMQIQNVSHQATIIMLDIEPDTDLISTVFRAPIKIEIRQTTKSVCADEITIRH